MIVIPMAGKSSRYYNAGYDKSKYELLLDGMTVFEHSISSFKKYFNQEKFLFIVRAAQNSREFIENNCRKIGIKSFSIIELENDTLGQADTVLQGLNGVIDQPILIFNIDTFLKDYTKPSWIQQCDGYLEVFVGEGDHWSFIMPGQLNTVIQTAEKIRISNYCSDGLYYFKSSDMFKSLVLKNIKEQNFIKGELYIAPMYNKMISMNKVIKYALINIESIRFCGTPSEYELINSDGRIWSD
jgi:dTDP-glucose pyrophosphorylase